MKTLPSSFTSKGFTHELVRREADVALFKRYQSNPDKAHYEVIIVQSHNGRSIGEAFIEPAEFYPSTSAWGRLGWTYTAGMAGSQEAAMKEAEARFSSVLEERSKPKHPLQVRDEMKAKLERTHNALMAKISQSTTPSLQS